MSPSLLLSATWACLLLVAYLKISHIQVKEPLSPQRKWLLVVVIVALLVRLVPNFLLPMGAGYDIGSYGIVGKLVLQGQDVYTSESAVNRHPYLPLQMYWMALAYRLAEAVPLPFVQIVRLAPIVADVLVALIIALHLRHSASSAVGLQGGLLYALNPVTVFVSAYHGQFDAIPALFLLLAALTVAHSAIVSGAWLGLGIWIKSWPVLGLPVLLTKPKDWSKKLGFLLPVVGIPLSGVIVYLLVFQGNLWTVINRAASYNWGVGVWGYTYFFRLFSLLVPRLGEVFNWLTQNGRYVTLVVLGFIWLLKARKEVAVAGVLTVLVGFFAVTHAFSIQYLMWVVPFAVINRERRWLTRYTLAAFAYMFLVYTTLILESHITKLLPWPQADWIIIIPAGLPAWLVTVGWLRKRLSKEDLKSCNLENG